MQHTVTLQQVHTQYWMVDGSVPSFIHHSATKSQSHTAIKTTDVNQSYHTDCTKSSHSTQCTQMTTQWLINLLYNLAQISRTVNIHITQT